jgi:uncharacterized protein (DUF433 family)
MCRRQRRSLYVNDRILIDAKICHGKPVVRGTRVPVTVVLGALAGGDPPQQIAADYGITVEDVRACAAFAAEELDRLTFHSLPA